MVIGDLHSAASRGVPVYIILNQRSTQEDCPPSMLRHPVGRTLTILDIYEMFMRLKIEFIGLALLPGLTNPGHNANGNIWNIEEKY